MSATPLQVTTDLSKILERIEQKIDKIDERLNKLEVGQAETKGEIKALGEKVDGIGKRLENQECTNRGILIGLVVTIVGGAAKLFGWVGNP